MSKWQEDISSFQSGLLSVGYLVAVLAMIRVGEKFLQKERSKKADGFSLYFSNGWNYD